MLIESVIYTVIEGCQVQMTKDHVTLSELMKSLLLRSVTKLRITTDEVGSWKGFFI